MSGVFKVFKNFYRNVGEFYGVTSPGLHKQAPPEQLKPPTIDEAQKNLNTSDQLRKRRGVLANLFAPSGGATGTVGTKQLLGD